jgi:hypothetical protein
VRFRNTDVSTLQAEAVKLATLIAEEELDVEIASIFRD